MLRNSFVRGPVFLGVAVLLGGAAGCGDGAVDDLELEQSAAIVENSLTSNSLTSNSLTSNSLTSNSLTSNSLTSNSLTSNSLTSNALRDPLSRELMKYIVSCALDEQESVTIKVDGKRYRFDGELGLAPEWGESDGSCDGSCQRWISACVLARVDAKGVRVPISVRGANRGLLPGWKELRDYTYREGAYYGNLFAKGQPRFLCLAPGRRGDERVCGDSLDDCPMTVAGSCDDVCAGEGWFGSFSDCRDARRHGRTYEEVITVFLQR